MTEYRIDELARLAGTTVRNVRAYQERGLLLPPRRQGRAGLFDDAHLRRLRMIGQLLERGYTLANIGELLDAWDKGHAIDEVLGLGEPIPPRVTVAWLIEAFAPAPAGPGGPGAPAGPGPRRPDVPSTSGEPGGAAESAGPGGQAGAGGPSGPGVPGNQGGPGGSGVPGNQGDQGDQGGPGVPGNQGGSGGSGVPGNQGDQGDQGGPGVPGNQGGSGGSGGPSGPGVPGNQGGPGVPGDQGGSGGGYEATGEEPAALLAALDLGVLEPDDGEPAGFRVTNPRMLRAAIELARAGIPLAALAEHARGLRRDVERLALGFVDLVDTHLFGPLGDRLPTPAEAARLSELAQRLRPLADDVVVGELDRAIDRLARQRLHERLTELLDQPRDPA